MFILSFKHFFRLNERSESYQLSYIIRKPWITPSDIKGNGPFDLEDLVVTQGGLLLLTSKGKVHICKQVTIPCYQHYQHVKLSSVNVDEILLYFCTLSLKTYLL